MPQQRSSRLHRLAEQPKPDSKLATSAGTATGLKPEDWKARTEKNARKDGKSNRRGGAAGSANWPAAAANRRASPFRRQAAAALKEHHESGRLWIVDGNFVRPVPVKIIATDGTMTEVRGKDVSEGMES